MKWFLLLLAIGLATSEKLDRTYLPPPGAQFAGGQPGDIQAPLELPHPANVGTIHPLNGVQHFEQHGPPRTPVTTTSYAFTQTTTFPSLESYQTTAIPINPITGISVKDFSQPDFHSYSQTLPGFTQNPSQLALDNVNLPPGFSQHSNGQTINKFSPSISQASSGPLNQYVDQNIVQQPDIIQDYTIYSSDHPNAPISNQYTGQNLINSQAAVETPSQESLVTKLYQDQTTVEQITPRNQEFASINTSPQDNSPSNLLRGQYSEIESDRLPSGQLTQESYTGQPINVEDSQSPQLNQDYSNKGQLILDGTLSQQPAFEAQNIPSPGLNSEQNTHQLEREYGRISSITPISGSYASSLAHSSASPIIHSERPQADADRNAVIINYDQTRTPNGYSYSYDTSNGIHADETGTVGNGTKAHGSYSYIGDDGKVYSVVYTADENGFQPHGDHLPTPPPIPEAIQKVIEQAARDKEAGIIDDGSYDEYKYGDKKYVESMKYHRPPAHYNNKFDNTQQSDTPDEQIKPITRITDEENDKNTFQDKFENNNEVSKESVKNPLNEIAPETDGKESIFRGNGYETTSRDDNQSLNDENTSTRRPSFGITNSPNVKDEITIQHEKLDSKDQTLVRKPIPSNRIKDIGTQFPETENKLSNDKLVNEDGYGSKLGGSDDNFRSFRPGQTKVTSNSNIPVIYNRKHSPTQRTQSNKQPSITNNTYLKEKRPVPDHTLNQEVLDDVIGKQNTIPILRSDYRQNIVNQPILKQDATQNVDQNGYYYNPPQNHIEETKFPNRFKEHEMTLIKKPVHQKLFDKNGTVRPFLTPEVYNQPLRKQQNQDYQVSTREPFMTPSVTRNNSYTDEDYETDQNNNDKTKTTDFSTHQPSTSRPQYTHFSQKPRVNQQKTAIPSPSIDYSNLDYSNRYTTPTPSHFSRFGNKETAEQGIKPQKHGRPSDTADRPSSSTVQPQYGTTVSSPAYGSRLPSGQKTSNVPVYTTTVPTTYKYRPNSGDSFPSVTRGTYEPSANSVYQDGYHYEPVQPQYHTTARPEIVDATVRSSTPNRFGTFILSGPEATTSKLSPNKPHPPDFQNIIHVSSNPEHRPNYESIANYKSPGPQIPQISSNGYQYGPPVPVYMTTVSSSTIGTTPSPYIPSTSIPGSYPSHDYSTTQQPRNPSSQGIFNQNVDGFGRPIPSEYQQRYSITGQQSDQYPGSPVVDEDGPRGPTGFTTGINSGPPQVTSRDNIITPGNGDTTNRGNQPKIIGEDFSGPKQAQRFDPLTGYHYK